MCTDDIASERDVLHFPARLILRLMTKSPLILLVGELPVPLQRRTFLVIKGFALPSSRLPLPRGCFLGFLSTGHLRGAAPEPGPAVVVSRCLQGPALSWCQPRRAVLLHNAKVGEGVRSGAPLCRPAIGLAPHEKNIWSEPRSESAIPFRLNPAPNSAAAKPFEVCHVQSIINHRKSGIISTSVFRSLQTDWCQLALINPASGQLLWLLFMQHFPAEIFKQ